MLRPVIVATAAILVAGSSLVYAQQRPGDAAAGMQRVELRHRPTAQDLAAFTDARIAALKAGLQLTADQTKSWPPFEAALRELAQLRSERVLARDNVAGTEGGPPPSSSPFDRLTKRADDLTKFGTALKHVADAGAPLYQSLDDAQKERFKHLSQMLQPHHRHFAAFWHGGREGPWGGPMGGPSREDRPFGDHGFGPMHRHFDDGDRAWPGEGGSRL